MRELFEAGQRYEWFDVEKYRRETLEEGLDGIYDNGGFEK
ncbi:unnamed protein product [marine sediment metagenome]|uniref:Uncharacterized protein n=1 Tax=marine sediment metagenome TaxID=412755 RepID=X1DFC6_9ZZZZ